MVSFETFDHMLEFAKEIDTGLHGLEEKLKNPSKFLYCDREEKDKEAHQILDSLGKELSDIQEEIGDMIATETRELEMLTEEKDKIEEYLKDTDKEIKHLENKLIPFGYKCKKGVNKILQNVHNVENEGSLECSLENISVLAIPKKIEKNVKFIVPQTNLGQSNKLVCEHYATPKVLETSVSSSKKLQKNVTFIVPQTNLDQSNKSVYEHYATSKVFETSMPSSSKRIFLSERENNVYSSTDKLCTAEKKRKPLQLKNDTATPKFNRVLFKETEIYTPPDPGFSEISKQVYALSVGRMKQKNLTK